MISMENRDDQREPGDRNRGLFIGNSWRAASGGEQIAVINPATESVIGYAAAAGRSDIDDAVAAAREAFDQGPWPRMTIAERAEVLLRWADELERDADAVTELLIAETGLTVGASRGGALTMPGMTRYYASLAAEFNTEETRVGVTGPTARIQKVPVGVVAALVPWNSPLGLASFKVPPALLAGCAVIVKPSEVTPLSAAYLADAALRAGLPEGVLQVISAVPEGSAYLVAHPGVDKVSFTGSTAVGRMIASGAAPTLKRITLELGGKSAAIVLDDADLDRVVYAMVPAVTNNNGEMCTVPSRLLVPADRHDEIVAALAARFRDIKVGDPADPATEVGPLVSKAHYDRVQGYLRSAAEDGGTFVTGGGRPADAGDTGYYIEPTIITGVTPQSRVAQEEIFAPVLVVLPYRDEEDAIALANGTEYGLNGAVFSQDTDHALKVASRMLSGTVSINNGITVDISIPFGGFKQSGYGRELGPEGLEDYLQTRSVFMNGEPLITLA